MGQQREYDTRLTAIFQDSPENWYQNVSIRDFTGAKDNGSGGDNWSCKMCKVPVKSSQPTNQHPAFLQARRPSCRPTNSVKAAKGKSITSHVLARPRLTWGSLNLVFDH